MSAPRWRESLPYPRESFDPSGAGAFRHRCFCMNTAAGHILTEEYHRLHLLGIDRAKHAPERQFSATWFRTVVQIKHPMTVRDQS